MIFPFLLFLFEINNLKKETTPIKEVESARGDWIQVFTTSTSVVVVVVVVLLPPLYGRIMFTLARGNGTSHILHFGTGGVFFPLPVHLLNAKVGGNCKTPSGPKKKIRSWMPIFSFYLMIDYYRNREIHTCSSANDSC